MQLKDIPEDDIFKTKVKAKIFMPQKDEPDSMEGYLMYVMGEIFITPKHPDETGEKRLHLIDLSEYPLQNLQVI